MAVGATEAEVAEELVASGVVEDAEAREEVLVLLEDFVVDSEVDVVAGNLQILNIGKTTKWPHSRCQEVASRWTFVDLHGPENVSVFAKNYLNWL